MNDTPKPTAWAVFCDDLHGPSIWIREPGPEELDFLRSYGVKVSVQPLYTQVDLDAAVAAERERLCAARPKMNDERIAMPDGRYLQADGHSWIFHHSDGELIRYLGEHECSFINAAVAAERERWMGLVGDGWRVLKGLDDHAVKRTSHQNVSDTLDALMRVYRSAALDRMADNAREIGLDY